jgi:hypothetical protein
MTEVWEHPEGHGLPPCHDEEIAPLGTDTDHNIAEKLGRTRLAVMTKRLSLRISASGRR